MRAINIPIKPDTKNLIESIQTFNYPYKILGQGEIKNKINLSVNFVSKQAKEKIEKIGGKLTLIKN